MKQEAPADQHAPGEPGSPIAAIAAPIRIYHPDIVARVALFASPLYGGVMLAIDAWWLGRRGEALLQAVGGLATVVLMLGLLSRTSPMALLPLLVWHILMPARIRQLAGQRGAGFRPATIAVFAGLLVLAGLILAAAAIERSVLAGYGPEADASR